MDSVTIITFLYIASVVVTAYPSMPSQSAYDTNDLIDDTGFGFDFDELERQNSIVLNKQLDESFAKCSSKLTINNHNNHNKTAKLRANNKHLCSTTNPYVNEEPSSTTGKLFAYDENVFGLVTNTDSTIRFYYADLTSRQITPIFTKRFRVVVPQAACTDNNKFIYVVFPNRKIIGKFTLSIQQISTNKQLIQLEEVISIQEDDFEATAITCNRQTNEIYVSELSSNNIRVYTENLKHVRSIELNGVVINAARSISISENVNVFADDSSAVGIFSDGFDGHSRVEARSIVNRIADTCHFYISPDCVEDVYTIVDQLKHKTYIYIVNSCAREILQYEYSQSHKNVTLINQYKIQGIPVSVISNDMGYMYVLTSAPYRVELFYPFECKYSILNLNSNSNNKRKQ